MREKPRSGSSAQSSKNTEAEDEATGSGDKSKQPATTYVHGEMLIGAIAALAMRDSFTEAVEIILGTNRLPGPRLESLVQQLFAKPALRNKLQDKVKTYVRKLEAARLLSRPTALGLHLNNLANDRRDKHIQGIYESISEGLLGSQPWITLQESAVSPQTPVHLSEMTWSLFMTAFMRCRRTDLAGAVWDDMQKLGITPGVQIWNSLIDGYVELGDVEKAINTWNLMISQGCNPDALTYRAMLQALFNSHRSVDAMHRFREFEQNSARLAPAEDGVRLVVYNTVLSGLLWCKQEEEARSVLREMETRGPKPDIISINTFLKYYAAKGELNQLAATLDAIEPAGLKGDVFTFSIVLSALLKVRDDAADTVIKLMQKQGLEPNTATLSAIIDHLMKTQTAESFKTAFKILARMESNEFANAAPNEVTYTSMLASLHRADWLDSDTAREYTRIIWDKITSRRVQPSRVTYHVLLKACLDGSSAGGTQEALRYFRDMVSRRVRVTADTWYILLHKLMKRQEWEIAIVMAREMEDSGFEPNPALADI
ncbi:hypothetical protein CERSUDRAFT_79600 [Gelatoporia subvermispora B]|uniref:PROP1-like PPR domain-containing protein n=1 Tax=Ceriporiopsis subvermispora (strain B) TaxID=914234 RepID=M2PYN6_CERS8|nr:hypothetical protein CERSUDRAFT_79600 [Gelatoporia subvermispora B]